MKRSAVLVLVLLTTPAFSATEELSAKEQGERAGYSVGYSIGEDFKNKGLPLDPDSVARGVRDALTGNEPALSKRDRAVLLEEIQEKMQAAKKVQTEAEALKNLEEGKKWLAENEKKEGVVRTSSGLEYKILAEGNGKSPTPEDTVTVHYRGRLLNGNEFDSSYKRGQPATFALKGVIPGWTEGLQLMKEGGKAEFYIPPELAYGNRRAGPLIAPNSTLIFEVELLKVSKPERPGAK